MAQQQRVVLLYRQHAGAGQTSSRGRFLSLGSYGHAGQQHSYIHACFTRRAGGLDSSLKVNVMAAFQDIYTSEYGLLQVEDQQLLSGMQ